MTGILMEKICLSHCKSSGLPKFMPITMLAAKNGPKAASMKKGSWLSSGTEDSVGIIIAHVNAKVNKKYSATMLRVKRGCVALGSVIQPHPQSTCM